eukprot:TRINITY_DN3435_c0_g1_i11.p1 TRINITY_DN3435_c0_g1~~TRINITY_DN3435_c0_g1_i11.p1  ORF type:complete len:1050 (+),score=537.19 TRINITY_DN3435_c0_g1_i11:908-4057(+)
MNSQFRPHSAPDYFWSSLAGNGGGPVATATPQLNPGPNRQLHGFHLSPSSPAQSQFFPSLINPLGPSGIGELSPEADDVFSSNNHNQQSPQVSSSPIGQEMMYGSGGYDPQRSPMRHQNIFPATHTFAAFEGDGRSSTPDTLIGSLLDDEEGDSDSQDSNDDQYPFEMEENTSPTSGSSPLLGPTQYNREGQIVSYSLSGGNSSSGSSPASSPQLQGHSQYGEHPFGEHPSRTLFVRNINSNVEDEELKLHFEEFGAIRSLYTQCKHRGFVMVSYYDIRHAKKALKALQGKPLRKRKLDIHYSIPKDNPPEKDQNQGTLVVFNLDSSVTNEELKEIFGKYGEIKEVRETPNKKHHKFIEFYDVRAADKAMKHLNKTEIKSKKIKIEPSRPGGARKLLLTSSASPPSPLSPNPSAVPPPLSIASPATVASSSSSDSSSSSPLHFASFSLSSATPPLPAQTAPQNQNQNQLSSSPSPSPSVTLSSSPSGLSSITLSLSSPPSSSPTMPSSMMNFNTLSPLFNSNPTGGPNGNISMTMAMNNLNMGMNMGMNMMPLNGQMGGQDPYGPNQHYNPHRSRSRSQPLMTHSYQQQYQQYQQQQQQQQQQFSYHGPQSPLIFGQHHVPDYAPPSAYVDYGSRSIFRQEPNGQFQTNYHANTIGGSIGMGPMGQMGPSSSDPSVPLSGSPFGSDYSLNFLPPPALNSHSGHEMSHMMNSPSSSPQVDWGSKWPIPSPSPPLSSSPSSSSSASSSPMVHGLQGPSFSGSNSLTINGHLATSPSPSSSPISLSQSTSAMSRSPRFFGYGGKEMSPKKGESDGKVEKFVHKKDDKLSFALDIERVRNDEEVRTTLMIKNIPNKYNQRMLLATVDELHKGLYDFFYLPIDFKNKCNVGYAFINFINPKSIITFYQRLHNNKWEKFNSEKVCEITFARIQGKDALINHFQNSSLMCEDKKCRPIIFHSDGPNAGQQAPFPVGPNVRPRLKEEKRKDPRKPKDDSDPSSFLSAESPLPLSSISSSSSSADPSDPSSASSSLDPMQIRRGRSRSSKEPRPQKYI